MLTNRNSTGRGAKVTAWAEAGTELISPENASKQP